MSFDCRKILDRCDAHIGCLSATFVARANLLRLPARCSVGVSASGDAPFGDLSEIGDVRSCVKAVESSTDFDHLPDEGSGNP